MKYLQTVFGGAVDEYNLSEIAVHRDQWDILEVDFVNKSWLRRELVGIMMRFCILGPRLLTMSSPTEGQCPALLGA